jgi:acyl-CoA dehydrogenase
MVEQLPKEIQQLVHSAEQFLQDEVYPREAQLPASGDVPDSVRQAVIAASKQAGFFYKTQPVEYGGDPASTLELTALRETWAKANSKLTAYLFGPGPGVLHQAQGALKQQYLDPVMKGEKRGAFGFTEPDHALRPTWARLQADQLLINGQKSYITGGATADFLSILVNVEHPNGEKAGTAMVVVDRQAEGVVLEKSFRSMEGGGHSSFLFEDVVVSRDQMIGELGEGLPRALANIGNVRLMVASQATGMCLWVLSFVEQHLRAPHRSGTPLGDKEGVRLRYADMRIKTFVARSALYRAARIVDSDQNSVNEVIATKVFCTETAGEVIDMAVQLVGGQALVEGHPLESLYRRVRSLRLIEGANDLLRINLVKGRLELDKGTV